MLPHVPVFRGFRSGEYDPRNSAAALLLAVFLGLGAGYYLLWLYRSKHHDVSIFLIPAKENPVSVKCNSLRNSTVPNLGLWL